METVGTALLFSFRRILTGRDCGESPTNSARTATPMATQRREVQMETTLMIELLDKSDFYQLSQVPFFFYLYLMGLFIYQKNLSDISISNMILWWDIWIRSQDHHRKSPISWQQFFRINYLKITLPHSQKFYPWISLFIYKFTSAESTYLLLSWALKSCVTSPFYNSKILIYWKKLRS